MKTFEENLEAANLGDVDAQLELGKIYSGRGGVQNKREAYIWLYIAEKDNGRQVGPISELSPQAIEAKKELKELVSPTVPTYGTPEELSVFEDIEPLKQEAEKRYEEIQERINNKK